MIKIIYKNMLVLFVYFVKYFIKEENKNDWCDWLIFLKTKTRIYGV